MDIAEAIFNTTIHNLPIELIEKILEYVVLYESRKNSRSVCKIWCDLINRDSTSEIYYLSKNNVDECKFKNVVPEFLSYNRRRTTFCFRQINLENTEYYWINKGDHIERLIFNICETVPFVEIFRHCNRMKELRITTSYSDGVRDLEQSMEQCLRDGISNSSLTLMHVRLFNQAHGEEMFNFVQLVNGVLPRLETLELDAPAMYDHNEPDVLQSIPPSFKNFNIKNVNIILRNWTVLELVSEISFNSSPDVPISLLRWTIISSDDNDEALLDFTNKYYYRDMHTLKIRSSTTVSFLMFEEVMSNSCLESLSLTASHIRHIGTHSFENQLKKLELLSSTTELTTRIKIGRKFVQAYQKLELLHISTLSFVHFANIINGLTKLTELKICNVLPQEMEVYYNATLSNQSLKKLSVHRAYFIQTTHDCVYNLPNLEELCITRDEGNDISFEDIHEEWRRNIDHDDLKCMNCPKLTRLQIRLVEYFDHQYDYMKWLKNILNLFPNIIHFIFDHDTPSNDFIISDDELTDLLKSNPKLKYIGRSRGISDRIAQLRSRMEK